MDQYIIYSILNSLLALLLVVSVYKVIRRWGIILLMNKRIKMIIRTIKKRYRKKYLNEAYYLRFSKEFLEIEKWMYLTLYYW